MDPQNNIIETPVTANQPNGLLPLATPEQVKDAYKQYLAICQSILIPYDERIVDENGVVRQESDYARIPQKKKNEQGHWITEYVDFPKKSAWRKLARFYGVSTEILDKKKIVEENQSITWNYTVKAWVGTVSTMGEGSCNTHESNKSKTEHDAKATAHTRAKNRAISDLIGFGQVSAEEINHTPENTTNETKKTPSKQEKQSPGVGPPPKQKPRKVDADHVVKDKEPISETPDPDEEQVINAFLDQDLRTTSLIVVKRNGSVWVQHPADYPEEKLIKYESALTDAELEYTYHEDKNAWEVQL